MFEQILQLLFWLLCAHFIADFVLQPDSMAKGKRRNYKPELPIGQKRNCVWPYWLTAHASTHGMMITLVTQSIMLGVFEIVVHWITDLLKSEGRINCHADQVIHIGCKIVWGILCLS